MDDKGHRVPGGHTEEGLTEDLGLEGWVQRRGRRWWEGDVWHWGVFKAHPALSLQASEVGM
jgi:hypothetical protein